MAHETVTKSTRFYCVSLQPDICKTPVGSSMVPLPYTIIGEFSQAESVSSNVKTQSEPVILHTRSFIPTVSGDAPGTGGGVKSGTVGKKVETKESSSTKSSNATSTIQEARMVWMNSRNTIGRIYERAGQAARARIAKAMPSLGELAQDYKDHGSKPLHEASADAMDLGGKVSMGSAALGGAGLVVGATVVGAPAAVVMEAGAVAGGTAGAGMMGLGVVGESTATALDGTADYILTGKTPDVLGKLENLAVTTAESILLRKLPVVGPYLKNWLGKKKGVPGKTPAAPKNASSGGKGHSGGDKDGHDGGKTKQAKDDKNDKPSECCTKNGAPGGKPAKSRHPVHFGTGEEILHQTDFVLEGPTPIRWTRSYRSGSETEDWGVLGARWATPFTASVSVCERGIMYHDDSGRALRLPALALGQEQDSRAEGFTLRRDSDGQFTLTWRDGSTDVFQRGPDGWLPHGYDGANAMLAPGAAVRTQRYCLVRRTGRDGKGVTIERRHDAKPGEVLLRVRTDDGLTIEALRDPFLPTESAQDAGAVAPRIARIEQVLPDGSRLCHVSYRYEIDPPSVTDRPVHGAFDTLPRRCRLVAQTDLAGQSRTYAYRHQLLVQYTTYTGFAHSLEWVSLDALRQRWAGSTLDDAQLAARHPISVDNSYQARAIRTGTADGNGEVRIAYIDSDTTRVTDADGGVLEYRFNANWLATEVRRISPDGRARPLGRREWDRDGMLLADIDAKHNATRYSYDTAGNLTSVTDARGSTTRIAYDASNHAVAVTNALGHTTHRSYDAAGRIVESTDPLGRSRRYAYDEQGRPAALTDARGGVTRMSYDAAGRLVAYTDCSSFTSSYRYDGQNRLAEHVNAIGNAIRYQYDALGRLAVVTHRDQSTETFSYDGEGNLVAHTDPKGQVTRYVYNGHGLPSERIDAKGQVLRYRYDKALRLVELVNGNDESYRLSYDVEGRLLSETGFDGKTTTYIYDNAGDLVASECKGLRTDYARDPLGRLLAKSTADGSVRYAYDALGQLTAVAAQEAEQRYGYDAAGQLIDERIAYALAPPQLPGQPRALTAAFTLNHAYDLLGNRIQTTLPNGRRIDTQRYGSGHWHGTLWQGTPLVDLERDHLHRETARQIGTGRQRLNERRAYDPQSRLNSFTLEKGKQRLRERRYVYDEVGNLARIDDAQRDSIRYTYDPLGQLLSAVQPNLSETFAFDPAGNLLDPLAGSETRSPTDAAQVARDLSEQPAAGQTRPKLARVTHNLLRQYMGYSYEYDVQGNTVSKRLRVAASANEQGALELAYDVENRLTKATRTFDDARQVACYAYDAFGRRIAKLVTEERWEEGASTVRAAPVETTLFVWDGDLLVQEIHSDKTVTYLYEPDSFVPLARIQSGEGIASHAPLGMHLGQVRAWRLPAASNDSAEHVRAWEGQREAGEEQRHLELWNLRQDKADRDAPGDSIHYYQCDHLGTPLELLDGQGNTAWSARYRAWGRILRYTTREVDQPLRFQGQYEDAETGLYYNRHRYYDPDSARYVTPDPIGLLGGTNNYAYAPNSTAWVDPRGLARGKGACNPCACRDPASVARSWQGKKAPYLGVDSYTNTVVKKGTVLYTLYPHGPAPGNYFVESAALLDAGEARKYNDAVQVAHEDNWDDDGALPMRRAVHAFVVTQDTCVAVGTAKNNPKLGAGGATQYFMENRDKGNLLDAGRIMGFRR